MARATCTFLLGVSRQFRASVITVSRSASNSRCPLACLKQLARILRARSWVGTGELGARNRTCRSRKPGWLQTWSHTFWFLMATRRTSRPGKINSKENQTVAWEIDHTMNISLKLHLSFLYSLRRHIWIPVYLSFFYSLRRNFKTYLNTGFADFYLMPKYIIECILVTFFLIFIFKIHWHGFSKGAKRLPSTYNTIQCLFKSLWNIFLSFFLPHLKLISGKNAICLQNRRWVLFNLQTSR